MSIADNKKAFHDYFIEERYEAGLALEGWEVKAIRAGRANLKESYVVVKQGEVFLIGCHISPLPTASTHILTSALPHVHPNRSADILPDHFQSGSSSASGSAPLSNVASCSVCESTCSAT